MGKQGKRFVNAYGSIHIVSIGTHKSSRAKQSRQVPVEAFKLLSVSVYAIT